MLIPSLLIMVCVQLPSLSRRVNANSQQALGFVYALAKLIKKGEC
ncbi:hypothetical protein MCC10071_1392 [Bifidobacterium longum subsp. longum]|nr:hypothetical protein MCC10071_1392 [Bifidobacterium longum subsp. longum]